MRSIYRPAALVTLQFHSGGVWSARLGLFLPFTRRGIKAASTSDEQLRRSLVRNAAQ
jgi:hypothetical protein